MCGDGAVLGLVTAYITVRCVVRYLSDSSALRRIRGLPEVRVSDLKTLVAGEEGDGERLVVVRGTVEARSSLDGDGESLWPGVLVSRETGEIGVVLQRTQTCLYNEWKGFLGWFWDLRTFFSRLLKEQKISSRRMVPFALVEKSWWPKSQYPHIFVNLDGSTQPLPLTTIYHQMHPVKATPYSFLQAFFGHEYPVALVDEEKMLLIGKEVYAVGICRSKDGVVEIRSSEELPYFLSDMNKEQMIADLTLRTGALFWGGILLGSISVGILGYSVYRNWTRWKRWRALRTGPMNTSTGGLDAETVESEDEDPRDIPDGELCVICLLRRRRCAFVPCGHQVCCLGCALTVQNELLPKCPVCRQAIRESLRIYGS
uniref:RING-type E3 ubiquitin transferase n=2 Tax=Kalanchoe fedtschenkoi TaxID=63787 RepID=A0A7N0TYL1_KALFE